MKESVIKNYPDYKIDTNGTVTSYIRGKAKVLKPQKDTDGYLQVKLSNGISSRLMFVHRLVAETFLEKEEGCYEVNHVDGNKLNNDVSNLEWCDRRRNMLHAHDLGLAKTRTPLIATNIETKERTEFRGQHDAARILGISQGNIAHALKRNNGSCGGYRFEYLKDGDPDG